MRDSITFFRYHRSYVDTPHIVRTLVSESERDFLNEWAVTFVAVKDQECITPEADRVLTATRETWRYIADELDAHASLWKGDPHPQTDSMRKAREWCEAIRVRVLDEKVRYFGYE